MTNQVPAPVYLAARAQVPVNRKVAVVADSRGANGVTMSALPNIHRSVNGWQHYLGVLTNQRIDLDPTYQFAVAGKTSEEVKPFMAQACATDAGAIILFASTNDRIFSFTATGALTNDSLTNIGILRDMALNAGKVLIIIAETPRGTATFPAQRLSGTQLAYHLRTHQFILDQDRQRPDVYVVDPWRSLALPNSATGDMQDAVTLDGIHQSVEGGFRLALALQPLIEFLYPPVFNLLSCSNADIFSADNPSGNIGTNPTLGGTTGTKVGTASGTVATGFQAGGSPNITNVCDIYTDPVDGSYWQRHVLGGTPAATGTFANVLQNLPVASFVNGGLYQASVEVAVDNAFVGVCSLCLALAATIGGTYFVVDDGYPYSGNPPLPTGRTWRGVYRTPKFVIPQAGAITSPAMSLYANFINGANVSGGFRWRYPTIRRVG